MRSFFFLLLVWTLSFDSFVPSQAAELQQNFYKKSCPQAEEITKKIIWNHVASNPELAAKFLRMFFHDCIVRGCDASILLDSVSGNKAEKEAIPNKSIVGFEIIDEVKTALEKACPETVSCADIVALAARDSVSFQFKKPLWQVQTGRRDGSISKEADANAKIPTPFSDFSTLVKNFSDSGLSVQDLVVLSGAHTIGVGHCNLFSNRLYNFTGKNNPTDTDPSINPSYAAFLKTKCTSLTDTTTTVPMDPGSSTTFDPHYYVNLKKNQGMFQSDAALLTDGRASNIVDKLTDEGNFFNAFKNSIKRMGQIRVLTSTAGEIRKNCRVVNS